MILAMIHVAVTVMRSNVPEFEPLALVLMMAAGICGGILGRKLNKKLSNKDVDKLFIAFQVLVVLICAVNFIKMM